MVKKAEEFIQGIKHESSGRSSALFDSITAKGSDAGEEDPDETERMCLQIAVRRGLKLRCTETSNFMGPS